MTTTATFTDGTSAPVERELRDPIDGTLIGVWTVHGRYVPAREVAGGAPRR